MTGSGAALEGVIFDWGGTLSEYAVLELAEMWELAAEHLAPHLPEDEVALVRRLGEVEEAFWARTAGDQRAGTLAELLGEATRALGVDVGEAVLEEAGVRYLDAWTPRIRHDVEAAATLEGLRARGLKVGLLSNTHWPRRFHERFLERDGLAELIDARVYTSELEYMKPHPAAFGAALDALGLSEPSRVVFVGDRPLDDIEGARRVGMRTVLRPNPHVAPYEVTPDATIERLPELLELVDRWGAGE